MLLAAVAAYTLDLSLILPDAAREDNFYFRLNQVASARPPRHPSASPGQSVEIERPPLTPPTHPPARVY